MVSLRFSRILPLIFMILGAASPAWAQDHAIAHTVGAFLTLPQVAGTLLALGILFGFIAIITPGTGVPEVLCFVTFSVLFGGRYLTGGEIWIPLGLLFAGGLFALVELFLFPGSAVFGVLSLLSFGSLSVILMDSPRTGLAIFSVSMVLCIGSLLLMLKFLPNSLAFKKFLALDVPEPEKKASGVFAAVVPSVSVGEVGEVVNTLRPVGHAKFESGRLEVLSEGEFLQKGAKVEVLRVEGSRIVVRSLDD